MSTNEGETTEQPRRDGAYRAFLLRCWREPAPDGRWRFALVQMDDKQSKKGFASLEALMRHLKKELAEAETLLQATRSPEEGTGRRALDA